jgi:hypothetical protein
VYINVYYRQTIITIAQIGFSIFKIFWASFFVPKMFQLLNNNSNNLNEQASALRETLFYFIIVTWNNVVTPAFVTSLINPSCFYNAIVPTPLVETSQNSSVCCFETYNDFQYCINIYNSSKSNEPFIYNYQCTFAFIQSYAAAYAYLFLLKSFFIPFGLICFKGLSIHLYNYYDKWVTMYSFIVMLLPMLLKPIQQSDDRFTSTTNNNTEKNIGHDNEYKQIIMNNTDNEKIISDALNIEMIFVEDNNFESKNESKTVDIEKNSTPSNCFKSTNFSYFSILNKRLFSTKIKQIFNYSSFLSDIIFGLCMLSTFGVVFPPLGAIILISLISTTYFNQILIARMVVDAEEKDAKECIQILAAECEKMMKCLQFVGVLMVPFSCGFYAFFVFDILGDKVGFNDAIWAPVAMICFPILMFLCEKLVLKV